MDPIRNKNFYRNNWNAIYIYYEFNAILTGFDCKSGPLQV